MILYNFQSPITTQVKNAFQVAYKLYHYKSVTFANIANIMEAKEYKLPENLPNCQASGVDTQGGKGSVIDHGIKGTGWAIITGFYKNF